jgi:hypothetical protein
MLYPLIKSSRYLLGGFYIPALGRLAAAAKQDHNFVTLPGEVYPVAGAVIDTQLRDAVSNRLGVAKMTDGDTADTGIDDLFRLPVFKRPYPVFETFGLMNYYHI